MSELRNAMKQPYKLVPDLLEAQLAKCQPLIRQQVLKEVGEWLDIELTPCGFITKSLEEGIVRLKQGQIPEEK